MRNKGVIAVFTLLAFVLSISAVWLLSDINKKTSSDSNVLGTATTDDLNVSSTIDYIKSNTDGSSEIRYIYIITNTSDLYNIISITSQSNLQETFNPYPFTILALTGNGLTVNPNYNGSSITQLLANGNSLDIGESGQIFLTVKFFPQGSTGPFNNRVTADGDIELPPSSTTTSGGTGGSTSSGSTTGTPPSTTTSGSTTGGSTGTSGGSGTGGVTVGTNPPTEPVSGPSSGTTTGGSGGTGSTTGGGTTGGSTGASTGGTTSGGDPDVVAADQVSFTLTASGGGGTITQLPGTSILPLHFGLISNVTEWFKDNIFKEDRNKIVINNIGVNGEIFEGDSSVLNSGFWRLPESSTPELGGNTIIAGHRFTYNYGPYTFYNLDKLQKGDSINLIWEGKNYSYIVKESKTVEATDLSILEQSNKNILTLITCTSWDLNEPRLIIQAVLQ